MIYATSESYFTVWRGTIHERYAEFSLSTSRKDKKTDEYKNSNWNFVRFVGDAFEESKKLKERDRITNVKFALECEPYTDRNGETVYPKSPRIVVFSFEMAENSRSGAKSGVKPKSKPYASIDSDNSDFEELDGDIVDSDLPF